MRHALLVAALIGAAPVSQGGELGSAELRVPSEWRTPAIGGGLVLGDKLYTIGGPSVAQWAPEIGLRFTGGSRRASVLLRGVVSPVYALNILGRPISGPGEGLFGFNFSVTGTTGAPRIGVNPMSILAPGRLRELFRMPGGPGQ